LELDARRLRCRAGLRILRLRTRAATLAARSCQPSSREEKRADHNGVRAKLFCVTPWTQNDSDLLLQLIELALHFVEVAFGSCEAGSAGSPETRLRAYRRAFRIASGADSKRAEHCESLLEHNHVLAGQFLIEPKTGVVKETQNFWQTSRGTCLLILPIADG